MEWRTSIFMRDGGEGDQGRRGIPNLGSGKSSLENGEEQYGRPSGV